MTIDAGPDELFTTLGTARDVPAIVALVNAAYRGLASRRGWTSEADLIEGLVYSVPPAVPVAIEPGEQREVSATRQVRREAGRLSKAGDAVGD